MKASSCKNPVPKDSLLKWRKRDPVSRELPLSEFGRFLTLGGSEHEEKFVNG